MIRPDTAKWNLTPNDLLKLATESSHRRTRERFLALYQIATCQTNSTQWSVQIGRCDECVMSWVHLFNEKGPEALVYRRTGGASPFLRLKKLSRLSRPLPRRSRKRMTFPEAVGR
jgi:hypothetical protein